MDDRPDSKLLCVGPPPAFLRLDRTEQCVDPEHLERALKERAGEADVLLAVHVDPRSLAALARSYPRCTWWSAHARPCAEPYLRSTLLSGLSHSLRSPLAVVQGAVDELQERLADDSGEWNLIRRGTAKLRRTASLLSDVAELESRTPETAHANARETTLHEVAVSAWHDARAATPLRREIALHARMGAAALPVLLRAPLLHRALREIFINARQHADSLVEVHATSSTAGWAVEVIDDGPGPGLARDPGTWERFVPTSLRGTQSDLGLGLSIARDEVHALGALIQIHEANSTSGTTVRISAAVPSLHEGDQTQTLTKP